MAKASEAVRARTIIFFIIRLVEFLMLIPIIGMLGYYVNGYTTQLRLTAEAILLPFIVAVIAGFYCLFTLASVIRHNLATVIAFIDWVFAGFFVVSLYLLRAVCGANCADFWVNPLFQKLGWYGITGPGSYDNTKTCNMLTAVFAFLVIEVVLFTLSGFLMLLAAIRDDGGYRAGKAPRSRDPERAASRSHHSSYHSSHHSSRGSAPSRSKAGTKKKSRARSVAVTEYSE